MTWTSVVIAVADDVTTVCKVEVEEVEGDGVFGGAEDWDASSVAVKSNLGCELENGTKYRSWRRGTRRHSDGR
jgi:hypothetical protein